MTKRVTQLYSLGATQSGVDFVDVDVLGDVPVYIDPPSIRVQTGDWADACVESLQTFFEALLGAIRDGDEDAIRRLITPLSEPNETHLGVSVGKSRGRGLGSDAKAQQLIDNLRDSKAAKSGFLSDLEDTALLVEGIDRDIVSDITTCVIRKQLIEYTQAQCAFHSIPMESQASDPWWDTESRSWVDGFVELPRANDNLLLLVPKSIVRVKLSVDKGKYYRGYLRPFFEAIELAKPSSHLVEVLKDQRRRVRKTALDAELGTKKADIVDHTEQFPDALKKYKGDSSKRTVSPLSDEALSDVLGTARESLSDLLDEILAVKAGKAGANSYHRAVAKLLTALFDTQLGNEKIEDKLHGDLKRIDITYDNIATEGFFAWLRMNFAAARIVVECKNYDAEIGNPEFDQIAMRLSPKRGQFGLLVCRTVNKPDKTYARAKNITNDDHGYVVVLTDEDLKALVAEANSVLLPGPERYAYTRIRERFDHVQGK